MYDYNLRIVNFMNKIFNFEYIILLIDDIDYTIIYSPLTKYINDLLKDTIVSNSQ